MNEFAPRIIATLIRAVPVVLPHLSADTWQAFKAAPGYEGVRNTYWAVVYDAVYDYLTGSQPITSFRNAMQRGMADAFIGAAEIGYEAGGGELPFDEDTLAWLGAEQTAELGHIADLFARLKEEWDGIDPISEAFARADGYAGHLDAIYGEAKMRGSKNVTVTWHLGQTEKHCPTCAGLDGQKHRLSWFISRDYIPRKPGAAMVCNGYNCDCRFTDKDGNEYTV
jgi:hypothetical protein